MTRSVAEGTVYPKFTTTIKQVGLTPYSSTSTIFKKYFMMAVLRTVQLCKVRAHVRVPAR